MAASLDTSSSASMSVDVRPASAACCSRSTAPRRGWLPERDEEGELVLDEERQPVLATAHPRWVSTGRVVLDNKGNPVRQYEPYFSSTEAYEAEAELREQA